MEEEECLYLLETVALELPGSGDSSSSTSHSDEAEPSAISLHGDPTVRDRYFVRHNTGVHSVHLPAVQRLQHFLQGLQISGNVAC